MNYLFQCIQCFPLSVAAGTKAPFSQTGICSALFLPSQQGPGCFPLPESFCRLSHCWADFDQELLHPASFSTSKLWNLSSNSFLFTLGLVGPKVGLLPWKFCAFILLHSTWGQRPGFCAELLFGSPLAQLVPKRSQDKKSDLVLSLPPSWMWNLDTRSIVLKSVLQYPIS